jgi:uncharacterized protein (TIGR02466 family)
MEHGKEHPLNTTPLQVCLTQALELLRQSSWSEAKAVTEAALRRFASNADLLQLHGLALKGLGDLAGAQQSLRRSLALQPAQPNVANNLGNLVSSTDPAEAEALFRTALRLSPGYLDPHLNLCALLSQRQDDADWQEALRVARQAIALAPQDARCHEAAALAALRLRQVSEAIGFARKATQLAPARARAWHRLGEALLADDCVAEADEAFATALGLDARLDAGWSAYALTRHFLGDRARAEEASLRALELDLRNLQAHEILNDVLWTGGRTAGHLGSYRLAIQSHPSDTELKRALATQLIRLREHEEARAVLRQMAELQPQSPQPELLAARLEMDVGDLEHALRRVRRATHLAPQDPEPAGLEAELLLRLGQPSAALTVLERAVQLHPLDQDLLGRLALTLRRLDDARYRWLCDYDRMTAVVPIVPPDGETLEAYCARLAVVLRQLHSGSVHPLHQTLRHGTQTVGQLLTRKDMGPEVAALSSALSVAVRNFIQSLPTDAAHPFFGRNTGRARFSGSWSARLSAGGHHTHHIHPQGWISSAFYVALPEDVGDPSAKDGWLSFGQSDLVGDPLDVPDRYVRPQVGHLVLFPSYVWHGTNPFVRGQERLTVAFDAVPD